MAIPHSPNRSTKDRSQFLEVFRQYLEKARIDTDAEILVIGGRQADVDLLRTCGFSRIALSTIDGVSDDNEASDESSIMAVDAEDMRLPDDSYDIVFAHEVLHHCRSPHRALCEMLRVARRYAVMMEPNDSTFMNLLTRLGFSFPFEIAAVVDNDYVSGGLRNSQVPNYIYRWNAHEVSKTTSSFLAERMFNVYVDPYWEFNADEKSLAYREQTRIGVITGLIGARNFIRILHAAQRLLNGLRILRRQGNKFFCAIEKRTELRPWMKRENGQIVFDRKFQRQLQ